MRAPAHSLLVLSNDEQVQYSLVAFGHYQHTFANQPSKGMVFEKQKKGERMKGETCPDQQ